MTEIQALILIMLVCTPIVVILGAIGFLIVIQSFTSRKEDNQ